jgi:5-methylcytosine-specific restriction endonuclease McrA
LCEKYHKRCLCCDKRRKLTADHVIPVSKGGTSDISNIQPLCQPCNSSKGAKIIDYR